MKNSLVFILILLQCSLFAQSSEHNLQKYWRYRERLKNLVVTGDCQGCSLPSTGRNAAFGNITEPNYIGNLTYGDETQQLGYYIAMLATEYRVEKDQNADLSQINRTIEELFYAIETINRLDINAEKYWQIFYNHNLNYQSTINDLNGFFIRDDVPLYFGNTVYNNDLIENQLNNSFFPPRDNHKAKTFSSGFTSGTAPTYLKGPVEESLDQVILLYTGLAMVVKFVDHSQEFSGHVFTDTYPETKFVQEAKNICERIYKHMRGAYIPFLQSDWIIKNPATNDCPWGVAFYQDSNGDPHGCGDTNCSLLGCNGANCSTLSYGFLTANAYIQNDFNTIPAQAVITAQVLADHTALTNSLTLWPTLYRLGLAPYQMDKVLSLAAIGNTWFPTTDATIAFNTALLKVAPFNNTKLIGEGFFHQLLHNSTNLSFSPAFFECLLDQASCSGEFYDNNNYEWSGGQRFNYGVWNGESYDVELNGIDYMLLFNMFNLVYPNYCNYRYIAPTDLLEDNIFKFGPNIESDHKRFYAATSVVASNNDPNNNPINDYVIINDDDPMQPLPIRNAKVEFVAGKFVDLLPGFRAETGVLFTASISSNLHKMFCDDPADLSKNCDDPFSQNRTSNPNGGNSTSVEFLDDIKSITIVPNPNSGAFRSYSYSDSPFSIEIFDLIGKKIWRSQPNLTACSFDIDLSSQAKGIYYVKATYINGNINVKKVIIQ